MIIRSKKRISRRSPKKTSKRLSKRISKRTSKNKLEKYLKQEQPYLVNSICKFIPLFKLDVTKKKNIISTCFFKMKNSYKSFENYTDGLKILSKYIKMLSKSEKYIYTIRLFIDRTIYDDDKLMSLISKLDNIECVLYDCVNFKSDDLYHYGVFGTLVRCFPMFKFKYNDANRVILSDIDEYYNYENTSYNINITYLNKFDNINKYHALLYGDLIYKNNAKTLYKNIRVPYVIMPNFIALKSYPTHLLINFLNRIKDEKIINLAYIDRIDGRCENDICYGIDEYFLNEILIKKYIMNNKLPCIVGTTININRPLYIFMKNIRKYIKDKKRIESYKINVINILTNDIAELKNSPLMKKINYIKQNINFINNQSFTVKGETDIKFSEDCKYVHNFYKLIKYLLKKKDYRIIPYDSIKILLSKDFIGTNYYLAYESYFTKNKQSFTIANHRCTL